MVDSRFYGSIVKKLNAVLTYFLSQPTNSMEWENCMFTAISSYSYYYYTVKNILLKIHCSLILAVWNRIFGFNNEIV